MADGLHVPVLFGRGEDGHDLWVDLADPTHWVLQGMTRSGKSSALYTLIGQVLRRTDVSVGGVDYTGLVLGPLADIAQSVVGCAVGANAERAVTVLASAVSEMDNRIAHLRDERVDQLLHFTDQLPLLVVIVEEWPSTLGLARAQDDAAGRRGGDRLAPGLEYALLRLTAEGAKVGIRVVLAAQRAEAAWLSGYVRAQFGARVTLRVDNRTSVAMLHEDASPELVHSVSQFVPGQAVFESPGVPRQVVQIDRTEYTNFLAVADSVRAERPAARAEGESAAARACLLGHLRPEGGGDCG